MLVFVALFACSGDNPTPAPPAEPAPVAPMPPSGGDHMAHMEAMAKQRDELRAALGTAYDEPVAGLDAADLAAGKQLFDAHCSACHGLTGKGDGPAAAGMTPPPADFTDGFHARYYSDAGRMRLIREGIAGTAMAGFAGTLTDAQVLDVYAYVRALRPPS